MFDRPRGGQRAVLVHLDFGQTPDTSSRDEFAELARSCGVEVQTLIQGRRQKPDARYYCGSGKAEEIAQAVLATGSELVVFNHELSPSQERNLEALFKCRVLDRTGLILDIFALRARSHEGKLQVELAQLQHLSTRLVRGWSHLERQRGGIGLRGPGETQLEVDRRLLAGTIRHLKERLQRVRAQRAQNRAARQKNAVPVIAVVGYTNAGKSTLFNALTRADVYAADQLFATLDPTLRRLQLDSGELILADTVGFVRDLPHDLVDAFRATLEETLQADLLLHLVDTSDPERELRVAQVEQVLTDIGAESVPQIVVYNKIDLCPDLTPSIDVDDQGQLRKAYVSAHSGAGLELLKAALASHFFGRAEDREIRLPPQAGRLRAQLFALGVVRGERCDDSGDSILRVRMPGERLSQLLAQHAIG